MSPIKDNPNLSDDKPTSSDLKQKYPAPYQPIQHPSFPGSKQAKQGHPEENSVFPGRKEDQRQPSGENKNFPPPYQPIQHEQFAAAEAREQKKAEEEAEKQLEQKEKAEEPTDRRAESGQSFQIPSYGETKILEPFKSATQIKAVPKKEPEKEAEPPRTIFSGKGYVEQKEFTRWMRGDDSLRKITKMGRKQREELSRDMLSLTSRSKRFLKKDDIERTIRGIKSGKVKPPSTLGREGFARQRMTSVLKRFLDKPKKK